MSVALDCASVSARSDALESAEVRPEQLEQYRRELAGCASDSGIAYVSPLGDVALVRVQERESGFFCDLEDLLTRLVPQDEQDRERLLCMLLGPRTEQIPLAEGQLCLGRWQRILLVDFAPPDEPRWNLTLLG